jgi:transcription termination factor Rho
MYDILQLNDMLLPELVDIAERLKITGAKKQDKQGLIYKILDSQAVQESTAKENGVAKKAGRPKKAVNIKTSTGATEEAEVMQEAPPAPIAKVAKAAPIAKAAPVAKAAAPAPPITPAPIRNNNEQAGPSRPIRKAMPPKKGPVGPGPRPRIEQPTEAAEAINNGQTENDPTTNIAAAIIQTLEASDNNSKKRHKPLKPLYNKIVLDINPLKKNPFSILNLKALFLAKVC